MTKTNPKTTRKTSSTTIKELQPNSFQHEILELVSAQKTNAKKVELLVKYRNDALVSILIWNFDETVVSLLPEGPVPYSDLKEQTSVGGTLTDKIQKQADNNYNKSIAFNGTEEKMNKQRTSLRGEYSKLYNFVKGGNDSLSSIRRETMFIQMLEGLHPLEAEIVCLVKDKKLSDKYKISFDNVKQAYPDIVWGGRS